MFDEIIKNHFIIQVELESKMNNKLQTRLHTEKKWQIKLMCEIVNWLSILLTVLKLNRV